MSFNARLISQSFEKFYLEEIAYRCFARADVFPLFEATRHPEFNRYLLWPAPPTFRELVPQSDKMIREGMLGHACTLSIVNRRNGQWCGFFKVQAFRDGAELGLCFHPEFWAKGLIPSAGCSIIQTLLDELNTTPLYVRARPGNIRIERVYRTYGFEWLEQMTGEYADGTSIPLDVYQVHGANWKPYGGRQAY